MTLALPSKLLIVPLVHVEVVITGWKGKLYFKVLFSYAATFCVFIGCTEGERNG